MATMATIYRKATLIDDARQPYFSDILEFEKNRRTFLLCIQEGKEEQSQLLEKNNHEVFSAHEGTMISVPEAINFLFDAYLATQQFEKDTCKKNLAERKLIRKCTSWLKGV